MCCNHHENPIVSCLLWMIILFTLFIISPLLALSALTFLLFTPGVVLNCPSCCVQGCKGPGRTICGCKGGGNTRLVDIFFHFLIVTTFATGLMYGTMEITQPTTYYFMAGCVPLVFLLCQPYMCCKCNSERCQCTPCATSYELESIKRRKHDHWHKGVCCRNLPLGDSPAFHTILYMSVLILVFVVKRTIYNMNEMATA